MKNTQPFVAAAVLALLCSCMIAPGDTSGTLSLRFESSLVSDVTAKTGEESTFRSLTPNEPWQAARFAIQGSGPDGATLTLESDAAGATARIVPGTWNIAVRAYSASGKETGSGLASLILRPSQTTQSTIQILPLPGTGNLSLTLEKNMALPAGSTLSGTLTHLGLPGQPEEPISPPLTIGISADQPSMLLENIAAGHYSLALRLKDDTATTIGGVVETIFVMKGFITAGTCRFVLGSPELDLAAEILPIGPLNSPLMSVSHLIPDGGIIYPLAVTSLSGTDTAVASEWYLNGEALGASSPVTGNRGFLPEATRAGPISCMPFGISLARMDYIEQGASGRSG